MDKIRQVVDKNELNLLISLRSISPRSSCSSMLSSILTFAFVFVDFNDGAGFTLVFDDDPRTREVSPSFLAFGASFFSSSY